MRAVLSLLVIGLAAAPATANPRARAAVPERAQQARERESHPAATPPGLREPARRPELARGVTRPLAPAKAERHEVKMPSMWRGLRNKIYDQLPHGGNDRAFSYTLMPMVITGAADSAPGVGLSGAF